MSAARGPLAGVRIVELGGVGAVPFCGMLLADLGADVLRLDRPAGYDGGAPVDSRFDLTRRSRPSVSVDLKSAGGRDLVLDLVARADATIEGFRPGVTERLGIGPDDCSKVNPQLVYGRLTGWGQDGPRSDEPGHDLNYISVAGALHSIGPRSGPPSIPLNLVGDLGGGALYLAVGVLAAVLEARASGEGQVVDAAMVEGAASLMTLVIGLSASGYWTEERGTNRLDSGAPWYQVYETSDGGFVSVAPGEARFYTALLELLGLDEDTMPDQHDRTQWVAMQATFADAIRQRTRDEWVTAAAGTEACLTPVLSLSEAASDPHLVARETFVEIDGITQPTAVPRFSRTPGRIQSPPPLTPGEHTHEALRAWGLTDERLRALAEAGAIPDPSTSARKTPSTTRA